ncbi:MAG TPA: energy transducer TonB [Holophagaceae bacterium]|nr:energy transducer TonB [Holophagaceae bacterium]
MNHRGHVIVLLACLLACRSPLSDPRLIDATTHPEVGKQLKVTYQPPMFHYPVEARLARVEGRVTVHAVVNERGEVVYAKDVEGPSMLTEPTVKYVRQFRYQPLMVDGVPRAFKTKVTLNFKLDLRSEPKPITQVDPGSPQLTTDR